MLRRESSKYTRYTNESIDDEDDEDEVFEHDQDEAMEGGGTLEQQLGDLDQTHEQMQEGRRVLAMMTPRVSKDVKTITRAETGRIVCMMVLTTVLCFIGGTLFGYAVRGRALHSGVGSCAGTLSPIPTSGPGSSYREDIVPIASHFLSHLSPDLIKTYTGNISTMNEDDIREYTRRNFQNMGYTVQERYFPVISSMSDKENPNTVEIVLADGASVVVNQPTDSLKGFHPFSPFSPNGSVNGSLVYANYAREEDFDVLEENGIEVNGSILLVRLCYLHPGIQVKNAEERGAVGVILYPDPIDFGWESSSRQASNDSYQGFELPLDGVVWQNLRMIPGDPSTPNYPSQRNIYRIKSDQYEGIPSVVVQPVSADTGRILLKSLNGSTVPEKWTGSLDANYTFGGTFNASVVEVRITTNNVLARRHSHVTFAYLPAQDNSKVVHVGCHYDVRDSRLTSSGIGLAGLLALGNALQRTHPNGTQRLVVFTAFEGRDGDFSAGNEYSQDFRWWLESSGMAYIDMDEIIEGRGFVRAHVSPVLREVARTAFDHVAWVGKEGLNVREGLTDNIPFHFSVSLDGKSREYQASFHYENPYECDESVNFVNVHGIPSLQFTSVHLNKSKDFHVKSSQYDTVQSVIEAEDPNFQWTHMIVSAMGVSMLILSSTPLPPAKFNEVGFDLSKAWKEFLSSEKDTLKRAPLQVQQLKESISTELDSFILTCESYDTWFRNGEHLDTGLPLSNRFRMLESRMSTFVQFGRRFLRPRNAPGHTVFGSLLTYGPSPEDPCEGDYFPFIRKALRDVKKGIGSWDSVIQEFSLLLSSLSEARIFPL